MGWLVALGILLLLAAFPLGMGLRYTDGDFRLKLKLAFVSIPIDLDRLLAGDKQEKEPEKQEKTRPEARKAPAETEQKTLPDLKALKPWIRLGIDFLGDLRRKLRIDRMDFHLILALEDPCDLAVLYGSTWAVVSDLQAHLNRLLVIEKQDVQVECDFTAEKTRAFGRLDLHITLGRAVVLLAGYGVRAVRELLSMKKSKGGA